MLNFSDTVSFVIANVPSKITDLHQAITGYEAGKITLVWSLDNNNGSPVTSYIVTRDVGSGVFFEVYRGIQSQFTDISLQSGQTYNYKVKAENVIGTGIESDIVSGIAG